MPGNYQLSMDDIAFQEHVNDVIERIAYVDECGSDGFDFSKEGTSKYYLLCAIVVRKEELDKLHDDFEYVKNHSGFRNSELKSSSVNDSKRSYIMNQLLPLQFRIVLFIADKRKFIEVSPLTEYKPSFVKFLDQHLYDLLYQAYPNLRIMQDETGWPEFKESFRKYVENHRHKYNLFNQYEFEFVNSKDETHA